MVPYGPEFRELWRGAFPLLLASWEFWPFSKSSDWARYDYRLQIIRGGYRLDSFHKDRLYDGVTDPGDIDGDGIAVISICIGGRRPKLKPRQQAEIIRMVFKGDKTAADAARLFEIHPATVSRPLSRARVAEREQRLSRSAPKTKQVARTKARKKARKGGSRRIPNAYLERW